MTLTACVYVGERITKIVWKKNILNISVNLIIFITEISYSISVYQTLAMFNEDKIKNTEDKNFSNNSEIIFFTDIVYYYMIHTDKESFRAVKNLIST